DPLGDVGDELAGPAAATEIGVPSDRVQAAVVEAVDQDADPGGRVVAPASDLAVGHAAAGQAQDPGVAGVDGVGSLVLHAVQLLALVRPQGPQHNTHEGSPVTAWRRFSHNRPETPSTRRVGHRLAGRATRTKVTNWKRH